jgi:hypothetical protein
VTATAQTNGAGIGSGCNSNCLSVSIIASNVIALGGSAPGIGSLPCSSGESQMELIRIDRSNVSAVSATSSVGIGNGSGQSYGTMVVNLAVSNSIVSSIGQVTSPGIGRGYARDCQLYIILAR